MEKKCTTCGENKPPEQFYKHPLAPGGRSAKCSECTKSAVRANRAARIDYYKNYDRMRAKNPKRTEARKRYALANPYPRPEPDREKKDARTTVGNALRDGKITKPVECEICTAAERLHGHHDDYKNPLSVLWICVNCHAFVHAYWRALDRIEA